MFSSLQEAYIADLDAKSGASLKLTLLNPRGRIWTMVAGGGASVVYRCLFALLYNLVYWLDSGFIGFSFSAATPSATWAEWMNWQTTANTLVRPVNSRPTTTRKLYSLWWHERGILKVSSILRKFLKRDPLFIQNNAARMLSLSCQHVPYSLLWSPAGKVLIIGGSIANFTNVAATFKVKLFLETL